MAATTTSSARTSSGGRATRISWAASSCGARPKIPIVPTCRRSSTARSSRPTPLQLRYSYSVPAFDAFARYEDVGEGFRADTGFVTRAGYRKLHADAGIRRYPESGLFSFLRGYAGAEASDDRNGERLDSSVFVGVFGLGKKNINTDVWAATDEVLVGGQTLSQTYGNVFFQLDPSRRFTRIGVQVRFGEAIDFDNARVGDGVDITLRATLHPTEHLELDALWAERTLDVAGGRLFTASVERLRATYVFTERQLIRLIGQSTETVRDPALYTFPVTERDGDFSFSGLYSFKLNWQTVLFLGYGDERLLTEDDRLEPTGRSLFFKISYAIQR